MKTYDSKLVDILANNNVLIIKDNVDLIAFRNILIKIGLDAFPKQTFVDLVADVKRWNRQHNKTYSNESVYYIEYRNDKGFGFWQDEIQNLVDWYGITPFSMEELLKEIK